MSRERGGWPKRPNGPESSASCFFPPRSVYESFEGEWVDEDSPVAPHSPYSKSKLDAERVLLDLADSRFKPVILRLPTLFGDSESLRLDVIVNKLVLRLLNGLPLEIHGEGRQFRPFAHVADVARIAVKALDFSLENRENLIVNTCLEKLNFSVREVVEAVANPFPEAVVTQGTHLDLLENHLPSAFQRSRRVVWRRGFCGRSETRDPAIVRTLSPRTVETLRAHHGGSLRMARSSGV